MFVSHFPWVLVFSAYSRSYSEHFSFSTVLRVSRHIPGPTVFFYQFHDFLFSSHIPDPTVCISHSPRFECFSKYSRSKRVSVSFSRFFSFLTIFQVVLCACRIFHLFQCSSTYFALYSLSFSFSNIFSILTILQVLQCAFLIFHVLEYFSLYSRSYSVCLSFFTFFFSL